MTKTQEKKLTAAVDAQVAVEKALDARDKAIRVASDAGISAYRIAQGTGLSAPGIRKIIDRA